MTTIMAPDLPSILALLIVGHCLADYPLQGEFLSRGKNRFSPTPDIPWYHAMFAHASIHAGFVGVITGSIWLGLAEFVLHWIIDDRKCAGKISFDMDQLLHIACKFLWVGLLALMLPGTI